MPLEGETPSHPIDEWRRALRGLLSGLPEQFSERFEALRQLRSVFLQEIAADVEPALQEHARTRVLESADERRAFAVEVGQSLQELGLTLLCPRTGKPALLAVATDDLQGSGPPRFQVLVNDDAGGVIATAESVQPPLIRIGEAKGAFAYSPFAWRLGRPESRKSR